MLGYEYVYIEKFKEMKNNFSEKTMQLQIKNYQFTDKNIALLVSILFYLYNLLAHLT